MKGAVHTMGGYVTLPEVRVWREGARGPVRGGIVLIHEVWGLVPHVIDVAKRLAEQGYVVYAPDLMSAVGTTPEIGEELAQIDGTLDEGRRNQAQPRLRLALAPLRSREFGMETLSRLGHVVDLLVNEPGVDHRMAVVGFCFGGTYAWELAVNEPRIRAAVPFYGWAPQPEDLVRIACPVLAIYGDEDEMLAEGVPGIRAIAEAAGIDLTVQTYAGAGHAFFNDHNARQWRPEQAADAWARALQFLEKHLAT